MNIIKIILFVIMMPPVLLGQVGYIDSTGKVIIPCEYNFATNFNRGLAAVGKSDKRYFINQQGEMAFDGYYETVSCTWGQKVIRGELIGVELNGNWGYIDRNGVMKIQPQYENADLFDGDFAAVRDSWIKKPGDDPNRNLGYFYNKVIDANNKMILSSEYDGFMMVMQGYAIGGIGKRHTLYEVETADNKNNLPLPCYYLIDIKKNTRVKIELPEPFKYGAINGCRLSESVIKCVLPNFVFMYDTGYQDDKGNVIDPLSDQYWQIGKQIQILAQAGKFSEIEKLNYKRVYLDSNKKVMWTTNCLSDGDCQCGYLDLEGKWIIPPEYNGLAGEFHNGYAHVVMGETGRWGEYVHGYIGKDGKCMYYCYGGQDFSEELAAVKVKLGVDNYKWGYINTKGEMVIAPQYDWAYGHGEGKAFVRMGEAYRVIDKEGKVLFDLPVDMEPVGKYNEGMASVRLKEKKS